MLTLKRVEFILRVKINVCKIKKLNMDIELSHMMRDERVKELEYSKKYEYKNH